VAACGIGVAAAALRVIAATLGSVLPPGTVLDLGGAVLVVAALTVVVAVLLVGLVPARQERPDRNGFVLVYGAITPLQTTVGAARLARIIARVPPAGAQVRTSR
jgi:hypothetical protein